MMIKEVKRRAVIGEKIKLVELGFSTEDCGFEVGKTYEVLEIWHGYPRIISSDGEMLYMEDYEYVVLEGEESPLEKFTDKELEDELKRRRGVRFLTCDLVCIKPVDGFTTLGKVYHVVDGRFSFDDGHFSEVHQDLEEVNRECISKFIKLIS